MWQNPNERKDGEDNDLNGYVDDIFGIDTANSDSNPDDDFGHGTHCAGTIGAVGNNGIGVVGVSWDVKMMACKFLDANGIGRMSDAIECLNYIIMMKTRHLVNVKVINASYGGGYYSYAEYDAIKAARNANILFVAAAGNDGLNNDSTPQYPSSYDLENIIAVANTDKNDNLHWSSNYGRASVDIAAPGAGIWSTIPGNGYSSRTLEPQWPHHMFLARRPCCAPTSLLTDIQP